MSNFIELNDARLVPYMILDFYILFTLLFVCNHYKKEKKTTRQSPLTIIYFLIVGNSIPTQWTYAISSTFFSIIYFDYWFGPFIHLSRYSNFFSRWFYRCPFFAGTQRNQFYLYRIFSQFWLSLWALAWEHQLLCTYSFLYFLVSAIVCFQAYFKIFEPYNFLKSQNPYSSVDL